MDSTLKKTAKVLSLISAIYQTIAFSAILVIFLFLIFSNSLLGGFNGYSYVYYSTTLLFMIFMIPLLIAIPAIILIWLARQKSANGSRAWAIYGIVHTILLADFLGLAAYICFVIEYSTENTSSLDDLELQVKKAKLEKELEELRNAK